MAQSAAALQRSGSAGKGADYARSTSESVRKSVEDTLKQSEARVKRSLERNVNQVKGLSDALRQALKAGREELSRIEQKKAELDEAITKEEKLLEISEKRRDARLQRPATETVSDEVQRELLNQANTIEQLMRQMRTAQTKAADEIAKLHDCIERMSSDLHDKERALELDQQCLQMDEPSGSEMNVNIQRATVTHPAAWMKGTEREVHELTTRKHAAIRLRGAIDRLLTQARSNRHKSHKHVERAMDARIHNGASDRDQLRQKLNMTNAELEQAINSRDQLEQSLEEKERPLALSRQRFAVRQARPDREQVQDIVESALHDTFNEHRHVKAALETSIESTSKEVARLEHTRNELQQRMAAKEGALEADKEAKQVGHQRPGTAISDLVSEASSRPSTAADMSSKVQHMEEELQQAQAEREQLEEKLKEVRLRQRENCASPLPE